MQKKYTIRINTNDKIAIDPDIIFNRFDLQKADKYVDLCIENKEANRRLQVKINGLSAEIGCFLMDLSEDELKALVEYIFETDRRIKRISYKNSVVHFGAYKENAQRYIDLPDSEEELHKRLTSKNRYNLKREKRLINDNIGEYKLVHYNANCVPKEVMEFYFEQKKETHKRDYNMSGEKYIDDQNISDIYVLSNDELILAVALSCEQCKYTYFENFSYNTDYPKYSLGSVLYDLYLIELINKGIKRVYLGSDLYEYKKHYGSIRQEAYIGEVYRSYNFTMLIGFIKKIYRQLYRIITKKS